MKNLNLRVGKAPQSSQRLRLMFVLVACALVGAALGQMSSLKSVIRFGVAAAQGTQTSSRSDLAPKTKQAKKAKGTPSPQIASPTNDNCAGATPIVSCPFTDALDTSGATDEAGEPASTCTLQGKSVWYTYTAGANTTQVTVDTCMSNFDTAIMVWRVTGGACNFAGFVPVICNDDFCGDGFQSSVTFLAEPGQTYKIQVGGFDGETGTLVVNVNCTVYTCPITTIHGTLGSNDPTYPGPRASGEQLGRLNRNGVSSSCAVPKTCNIFTAVDARAYDAYTFTNASGAAQCVTVNLTGIAGDNNLQSNAYLGSFDPNNICTNYLADPGLSLGVPPTPTNFSFVVPAGANLVLVVHTTNPGEIGGTYDLKVLGNLCFTCPTTTLTPGSLPNGTTGVAYNQAVTANPVGTYTYTVTTNVLPPGLSLNSATGALTGTPTASGNYTFAITATSDKGCTATKAYNLLVTASCTGTLTVNPARLANGKVGMTYNQTFTATGGTTPYTFAVTGGALPAGLTLNPTTGLLSGSPTAAGSSSFTITATSANGCVGSRAYTVTVAP